MGQLLNKLHDDGYLGGCGSVHCKSTKNNRALLPKTFPDLSLLPPEISLAVLSHLGATDLCLAACVWEGLGKDEMLWMG